MYGLESQEIWTEQCIRERIGYAELDAYDLECIAKSLLAIIDDLRSEIATLKTEVDPEDWPKEWDEDERAASEEHTKAVRARHEEIVALEHRLTDE